MGHLGDGCPWERPAAAGAAETVDETEAEVEEAAEEIEETADDVENHKPHPEPILKALGELNVPPANAVFIGDSPLATWADCVKACRLLS